MGQAPQDYVDADTTFKQPFAPESGVMLESMLQKQMPLLAGEPAFYGRSAVTAAFVQASQDYVDADATFKQPYAPPSGVMLESLMQKLTSVVPV